MSGESFFLKTIEYQAGGISLVYSHDGSRLFSESRFFTLGGRKSPSCANSDSK